MYVVSVKSSKLKAVISVVVLIAFLLLGIFYVAGRKHDTAEKQNKLIDLRAETAQERIAFLSQFGWSVEEEPADVKETVIPESFDDVYERYNELQKEQGFDLTPYCGTRVKQWSYRVLNYPGNESNSEQIRANLLVCNGVVIGGDISSTALDGFMQPFDSLENEDSLRSRAGSHAGGRSMTALRSREETVRPLCNLLQERCIHL